MSSNKRKKGLKDILKKNENTFSIIKFIVTYVVLMGGFFTLLRFKPFGGVADLYSHYETTLITATSKILTYIGISATGKGSLLFLPNITFDVRFGCNGLEAVLIYAVAVMSFPAKWTKKIVGIVAGFIIIQIINLLRIIGLAYSGVYHQNLFDLLHVYIAQGIMIAVALGIFLIYIYYLNYGKPERATSA